MPGPRSQLAPAVASQHPIDGRLGNAVGHGLFVGLPHLAYFQHAPLLGAGEEMLQQSLFGFPTYEKCGAAGDDFKPCV
jgi:hypothetical protein